MYKNRKDFGQIQDLRYFYGKRKKDLTVGIMKVVICLVKTEFAHKCYLTNSL